MKTYKDTELISEDCMVRRYFDGVKGGNKWLEKRLGNIKITHFQSGSIVLDREEAVNLKLFLEKALEQEF